MRPPPLCTQSPHANLFVDPPVHGVYNASTSSLGVVFVILLLSSPRRLQCCAWSPSGVVSVVIVVVMHRFTHANLKSGTSPPLGVTFVILLLSSPRHLQCCAWSLGSCARSPPPYNASTGPLGVAFVILLPRPRRRGQCQHASPRELCPSSYPVL